MRLLGYNILEGGEGRIDPIAEVIRQSQADVVVVCEAASRPLFEKLADRLGFDAFYAEKTQDPEHSVGLLSRWKIRSAINLGPSVPEMSRGLLQATVSNDGEELTLLGLHLHARPTLVDEAIRVKEVAALLKVAEKLKNTPHALVGDFNATHPNQALDYSKLAEKFKKRIAAQGNVIPREAIQKMLDAGYLDAHALHRAPEQFEKSMTTSAPELRVDYVFVSPELAPRVKDCRIMALPIGRYASDHYPVLAEIL